jgi:hypothetical protein
VPADSRRPFTFSDRLESKRGVPRIITPKGVIFPREAADFLGKFAVAIPGNAPSSGSSFFFRENLFQRNRLAVTNRGVGLLCQPVHFTGGKICLHLLVPLIILVRKKLRHQLAVFLRRQSGDGFLNLGNRAHKANRRAFPRRGQDAKG